MMAMDVSGACRNGGGVNAPPISRLKPPGGRLLFVGGGGAGRFTFERPGFHRLSRSRLPVVQYAAYSITGPSKWWMTETQRAASMWELGDSLAGTNDWMPA